MNRPDPPLVPPRGIWAVERIPGGATLYRVVFGAGPRRIKRQKIRFDDLEDDWRTQRISWVLTIAIHALLIGLPIFALVPDRQPDERPSEGMMVELVTEPDTAAGKGKRDAPPQPASAPADAPQGPAAGLPVLASSNATTGDKIAVGEAAVNAPATPTPAPAPAAAQPRIAPAAVGNVAGGPGSMSAEEARWEGAILERIEKRKRYPKAAVDAAQEDKVMLRLVIDRDGKLVRAEVARSAGYALLNAEVLALARRASPYPRPPVSVAGETISMLVPVEFFLKKR